MIDSLFTLLLEYKYWFVISAAIIEGEVLLLLAGMASFHGHLNLYLVMLIASLGAIIHDHVLFILGHKAGVRLLNKFPKAASRATKVLNMLNQYKNLFIFGFRFIYGIRTITPFLLGAGKISWKRYSSLTVIAALLWACLIVGLGYSFAAVIEEVVEYLGRCQKYIAVLVGVMIILIVSYKRFFSKKR